MRPISTLVPVLVLCAQSASAQAPIDIPAVPRRPFLFKDARGELAAARAKGERDVTLVIAAMPGANARLARAIAAAGGTIRYRDDDVDYLRARVPVDSVERIARDPAVHSIDITTSGMGRSFAAFNHAGGESATTVSPDGLPAIPEDSIKPKWPLVLPAYPLTNPYSPLADMGAAEFRKAHPTYDGRGVTMALIDLSLDALLPELQWATSLDGKPTPKIVVYESAIDPDDEDDGRWLKMIDTVTAPDGRFTYQGKSYAAPRAGGFRIAQFDEAQFDSLSRSGINKDVNRDGNPPGSSRFFAVLWDENSNDVWVDTNQDGSFTDERMLTDFSARGDFGVFGKDDPKTPVRETVSFAIQTDRSRRMVAINAGVASHASLIVGAAVASRGKEGRFEGVAPGARLANVAEGGAAYGQTEAVIRALKNPLVDLAWLEQSSGITRGYLLRDGRLVPTVIYSRLIEKYKKPLIVPTHNYPVINGTDDFVLAHGAIGIGGHESKDNFYVNHGVRVEQQDNLLITGGYGPMGDGSLKPDVISPSNILSTNRGFLGGTTMASLYRLPPGYGVAGGTSTATPTAAGAVAMLISAAKQTGVKYDAFRLKQALTMSARFVPHLPAYKQGNGVVNVGAAWDILRAMDTARIDVAITSRAAVRHAYSHLLATPNEGVGLYERDGWSVGDRGERVMTFTRTSGPRVPMTFALTFTGNDSTFSAPASVTLPLNKPVPVTIAIAPHTPGAHSALLTLDSPRVPGHAYRTLTTIIAAEPLTTANGFKIEKKTEVLRPAMRSFFYRVPEGVTALKVELDAPKREVAVAIVRPDTRTAPAVRTVAAASGRGGGAGGGGTPTLPKATYVVADPMPGVWEVRLTDVADVNSFDAEQAEKSEPVPATVATLTVSAMAIGVTSTSQTQNQGQDGAMQGGAGTTSATRQLSLTNRMVEFTGGAVGVPMGSARREHPTIHEKEQQVFEVVVPAGTTTLMARASKPSDPNADIDLYIFDCSGKECKSAGVDADPVGDESVLVQNPAAGKWKIIVDAPSAPLGSTSYEYVDVVFNPSYGMSGVADLPTVHSVGTQWVAKGNIWVAEALPDGRLPYAALVIQGQPQGAGAERYVLNVLDLPPISEVIGAGARGTRGGGGARP